jgi:glycosyltransferase involved in cell wall biosynthesis
MQPIKKLMVVGEVFVGTADRPLSNAAFDIRLREYAQIFKELLYIGPSDAPRDFRIGNIQFVGTDLYSKKMAHRVRYALSAARREQFFSARINDFTPDIVELRIPAVFPLLAHRSVRRCNVPIAVYVAGDWQRATAATFRFPGAALLGHLLDRLQWPLIRRSVVVVAGSALAAKYRFLNDCYVYWSTTHREVIRRPARFPPRNLLYVGRLEPLKRVEDALLALQMLTSSGRDFTLTIVGDGIGRSASEELARKLGVADRVHFVGYVHDEAQKRALYLASDILVFPSLSEGSPKVLPEAMAHGVVPIAIRDVGGIGQIIRDGVNGFLARPRDPAHIASLVRRLLDSERLLHDMMEAGYEYAAEHTLTHEVRKQWAHVEARLAEQPSLARS